MKHLTEKNFAPSILIVVLFFVYLSTICPTVYLGDSGELTTAAFSLGIPHNSGYPLYAILGKLFCLIPLGNIAFRMNLMSACFATLTLWIAYSLIVKITSSRNSGLIGTLVLAFTPVFWLQTVSAEVYTLHTFFVALLIKLLWWWDERREFFILLLFVFLTGISFSNHLQTVMLAPAVLFIILSGDKKAILTLKLFLILSFFFAIALSIYLYLPIRTGAGAAIHWGDPNSIERFLAHVTGSSHRSGYVFNMTAWEYVVRVRDSLLSVWSQFGIMLFFSVWGWLKLASRRWRVFYGLVVASDLFYTVFLNTISLKATAFALPSCLVIGALLGVGIANIFSRFKDIKTIGLGTERLIKTAICIVPAIALFMNYGFCDQSRNYTGYEQATNIFRTVGTGDTLIMMGDNHFFPIVYIRLTERMREDVSLYDRLNIVFRYPNLKNVRISGGISWDARRDEIEVELTKRKGGRDIFYAVSSPLSIKLQDDHRLIPHGILNRLVSRNYLGDKPKKDTSWKYYGAESFYDDLERDFMNREVCSHYFFYLGKAFFLSGRNSLGLQSMEKASAIGYDNPGLHTHMAIFLSERGLFEEARRALERALIYDDDPSYVYYIWGYYYNKKGEHTRSITLLQKAIALKPTQYAYYNYLGYVFNAAGRQDESILALEKSLSMKDNQPEIKALIEDILIDLQGESMSLSQKIH